MRRAQRSAAWALAVAATLAVPTAWAQSQTPPETASSARGLDPPRGALVAPGNAPDLIFLYTGDVIGYLEPCG